MNFTISEKAACFPWIMPSVCAYKKETGYASWAFKNVLTNPNFRAILLNIVGA